MIAEDRYDSLIEWYWLSGDRIYGPDATVDWRLGKCQVRAESNFNARAVSPAGAAGLLQLMPATAQELGVPLEERVNPELSLAAGLEYLWRMWLFFRKEQGMERWKFALGAYNAGARNIGKAQALAATLKMPTDRWVSIVNVLERVTGKHAEETIQYVARIVAGYERVSEAAT